MKLPMMHELVIRERQLHCYRNAVTMVTNTNLGKDKDHADILTRSCGKYFLSYDTGDSENNASNNSFIVSCVFVTAVTLLPSRCLAKIRGFLPSRCLATIRRYTDTQTHTYRQQRDLISLLCFFQNKESRLKTGIVVAAVTTITEVIKVTIGTIFSQRYEIEIYTHFSANYCPSLVDVSANYLTKSNKIIKGIHASKLFIN
jgi:hypothetical protein